MSKKTIVVSEDFGLSEAQVERLNSLGDVTYFTEQAAEANAWYERVKDYDVIVAGFSGFKDAWPQLKDTLVSIPFIGVDFVDLEKAHANNLSIANSPGCNKYAVSEWVMGMMVYISRNFDQAINTTTHTAGKVAHSGRLGLAGKNITILGRGSVGDAIKAACEAMAMNVSVFARGDDLNATVASADYVVNALSSNPSTAGILNAEFFASMKQGSQYISIARVETEDVDALLKEVSSGRIRAVAHDSGSSPSGHTDDPIYKQLQAHRNVFVTPHIAFNSDVSDATCNDTMIDNIEAWLIGEPQNIL